MASDVVPQVDRATSSNNAILVEDHQTSADMGQDQAMPSDALANSSLKETSADTDGKVEDGKKSQPPPVATKKGFGFFAIMVSLALTGLLTALEASVTSTALPTITAELGGGELFIWVVNGYLLTQTAFQPLFGQLADIYGRRWTMIISTATFILGSGICGGASDINMLIAGRIIQGIGASGINVLIEIIICDLLPLRERGKYLAMIFGLIALGSALGPFFGGLIVQHSSWSWIFYLNIPVGGLALAFLVAFLRVNSDKTPDYTARLKRIDWLGNVIFVLSMVSVLISLSWAGTKYPWSSFRVIVSLVMGLLGGAIFAFYEVSRYCVNPTMPMYLFSNRTSGTAYALTFLVGLAAIPTIYFFPVYFQAVLGSTPSRAGIQLLPTILVLLPAAMISGWLLSKFGRYRPVQHAAFALMVVGFGLLTLQGPNATTAEWVGYQITSAVGTGLALPVLLPAVQAALTEKDTALSTSTWAFVRSFGLIWGATIPTAAFNNRFNTLLHWITDPAVAAQLADGRAYEHATKAFMDSISNPVTRAQVVSVYVEAIKVVWYVTMAFAILGFLMVILQKEIPLRKELDTKFSMEEKSKPAEMSA